MSTSQTMSPGTSHLTLEQLREISLELRLELQRLGGSPIVDAGARARPPDDPVQVLPGDVAAARAAGAPVRLLRVLEALARIRSGRYGICSGCHGRIPFLRLLAIPETTTCVGCSVAAVAVRS